MITLITGENDFDNDRKLKDIVVNYDGSVEKYNGEDIALNQLPSLLMGETLFSQNRLVVIKRLSENKSLWSVFSDWIDRVSDSIHLVIVEPKIDKRSKTYKELNSKCQIYESKVWSDWDVASAQKWLLDEAKKMGFAIDKKNIQLIIDKVGTDQWSLYRALEKIVAVGDASKETVDRIIDSNRKESIFDILTTALSGDSDRLMQSLDILKTQEDPHLMFGLLCSQMNQIMAVYYSNNNKTSNIAKEMGIHPYALSKMVKCVKGLESARLKKIMKLFVGSDVKIKTTAEDPWLIIEILLIKITDVFRK